MQLIKKSALFALVLSSALICGQQVQAAKPSAAPAQETTLEVKAKLDAFAKSYVARANDTLKNNRQNMSVTKQGKGYVARYTEVDASTMTTEIYPGKGPGCEYVGHIVYLEKVYECTGKTISEAKTGTFTTPNARRIRDLTRYDGKKWIYSPKAHGALPRPLAGLRPAPAGGNHSPRPLKKEYGKAGRCCRPAFPYSSAAQRFTPHQILFSSRLSIQRPFSLSIQRNS